MKIKCEDGKYEWHFDEKAATLKCKRYGEEWRNETGDGAILALLQYAHNLQEKVLRAENCLVTIASPSSDLMEICNTTLHILASKE